MPDNMKEIKSAVVAAVNETIATKADAEALANAETTIASQAETITTQGAEIKELRDGIEEAKNLAADVASKLEDNVSQMGTKDVELQFDTKALNAKLREVLASGEKADFANIDTKTLAIGGTGNESLAIDEELGREIIESARENVAILGLINTKTVGSVEYREMVLRNLPSTGKVGENVSGTAAWALTGTQTYVGVSMTVAKQYSKPVITDEAIADPHIDIYTHLKTLLAEETSRYWAVQVLYGTGGSNNELRGILNEDAAAGRVDKVESIKLDSSARDVNIYPAKVSAAANSVGDDVTAIDNAIDMTTIVPSKYLGASKFVMNRRTLGAYRKLRDADNRPLIQFEAGNFFLVGYPVVLEDYMPNEDGTVQGTALTGKQFPVIFGDLKRAFALCSIDDKFLVDPYSADGGVTIKYSARKGDIVQNHDAIVVLRSTATWV